MTGTIVRLFMEKHFGFVKGQDGKEYFFHKSALGAAADFTSLREGMSVDFLDSSGPKGLRAETVTVTG